MASAVIGALRVNLSANTAAFSKGLKGAEGGLQRFAKHAKVAAAAIAGAMVAAVGGLAVAMRGMINEADRMGKMAQSIGVPVEELSRLKHAADLSGVSLEQMSTAVGRLSRNMNDVAQGAGAEARRAFEQLGIAVQNTDGTLKASSQVMAEVAERFRTMPDGAEKTALAMQLFGRAGAALIPMLNQGSAGLNAMMQEADRLGIVIDSNTAKAAERFNDNLTRMGAATRGIVTQVTAHMLPALDRLSQMLVNVARDGEFVQRIAEALIATFKFLTEQVLILTNAFSQVRREFAALKQLWQATSFTEIMEALRAVGDAGRQTAEENANLKARIDELFSARPVDRISGAFDDAGESISRAGQAADETAESIAKASTAAAGAGRSVKAAVDAKIKPAFEEINTAGQQLGSSLQAGFSSMTDSLIEGTFNARDALAGLLKDLARLFANQAFTSLIGGGLGGGGLFGGLSGFAQGGSFKVGGSGGIDSQVVAFKATPGERVDIRRPGQDMGGHLRISVDVDNSGNIIPVVRDVAGRVVASAAPQIAGAAVRQTQRSFGGMAASFQARQG